MHPDVVIGYAVTIDVKHVPTAVYDLDNTADSRELVAASFPPGYFDVVARVDNDDRIRELIDRGTISTVLRMNHGFMDDLRGGRTAQLQMIVDGTDSNTAAIVLSYAAKIAAGMSEQVLIERLNRLTGTNALRRDRSTARRAWFNENLESRNYYVPA